MNWGIHKPQHDIQVQNPPPPQPPPQYLLLSHKELRRQRLLPVHN